MDDQNFYGGQGWWMGEGSTERCLKYGGRGGGSKGSFQKHLKIGGD